MSSCFINNVHGLPKKCKGNPVGRILEPSNIQYKNQILSCVVASNWWKVTTSSLQSNKKTKFLIIISVVIRKVYKQANKLISVYLFENSSMIWRNDMAILRRSRGNDMSMKIINGTFVGPKSFDFSYITISQTSNFTKCNSLSFNLT